MKNVARKPGRPVRGSTSGRPIMAALDLFGRRGVLRILWEMRSGSSLTFRALALAADLSPATLNVRLKELREVGLLTADGGYAITSLTRELLDALTPLIDWSERWAKSQRSNSPKDARGKPRRRMEIAL
jgi:DNA-binding HxlR family transcriptional regulator